LVELANDAISELFDGVADAAEEAILNALLAGGDFVGRDGTFVPGLPVDELVRALHGPDRPGPHQAPDPAK
jgi:L-aminopeptidase/D-esterase-like protein